MKKKILIVDDEKDLCLLMKSYLSKKNYEVYDTYSLKDGMVKMEMYKPDILFLDNNLSDGTAWPRINDFYEINPNTEIFLMSGFQPPLPLNANKTYHVLTKPISFHDLDTMLSQVPQ